MCVLGPGVCAHNMHYVFYSIDVFLGIVYKAHIVKHKDGQVVTETMAVKTLKVS